MKSSAHVLVAVLVALLVATGCSKQTTIDTSALENSFKSAETSVQTSSDKAVAAIKAGDYSGAAAELKTLASNAKLTPQQQQAIKDLLAQVEKPVADAAAKAKDAAGKVADDVKKALTK